MKNWNKYFKHSGEAIIMIVGVTLFVFGLLIYTGALSEGFNLIDDKDLFRLQIGLQNSSFLEVCKAEVLHDFIYPRVRLLYYPLRIFMVGIIGTNFFYWSIYKALEIVGAIIFLYYFSRNFSVGKSYSLLFSLMCVCGTQSAVWWRLGCQESTGIFLLAVTLWLISIQNKIGKKYIIVYSFMLGVFILGVSTIKESFLLCLPVLAGIMVFGDLRDKTSVKTSDIINSIIKCKYYIIYISVLFFSQSIFIVYLLSKHENISGNTGLKEILLRFWFMLQSDPLKIYFLFGILFIFLVTIKLDDLKKDKAIGVWLIGGILSFVYMTVTQFFMYKDTGINERYLLPWIVGYSMFYCIIIGRLFNNMMWPKFVYGVALSLLVLFQLEVTVESIKVAAEDEMAVNQCLQEVISNSQDESDILVIMSSEGGEWNNATRDWLIQNEREKIYFLNYNKDKTYSLQSQKMEKPVFKSTDFKAIDVIVTVEDGTIENYLTDNEINVEGYKKSSFLGYYNYVVYYK